MPADTPFVTIAIPTLNRCEFLRQSVQSALAQTYSRIEVLVSDNVSDDETAKVLGSFRDERLRVLRQTTRAPMFVHWNLLLQACRGEYVLFLSDDDLLEPSAAEAMAARLKASPEAGLVFCQGAIIDSDGKELMLGKSAALQLSAEEMILDFFQSKLDLWPCSIMFRRSDVAAYEERFELGADAAAWIELVAKFGAAEFIPQVLARYRVHANTTAKTPLSKWHSENLRLAELSIEKLRERGRGNSDLYNQIRSAARRLNVRVTAGFIVASWSNSKRMALRMAKQQAGKFASAYGILVLIKSVIVLLVPRTFKGRLVALSRIARGNLWFSRDRTQNG